MERQQRLRLGSEMVLNESQREHIELTEQSISEAGFMPPSFPELSKKLGFSVLESLEYLTFEGEVVKVSDDLFFALEPLTKMASWIESTLEAQESLTVAELREQFGVSRKYAVPLLEFFDRQGWTRRQGDVRVAGRRLGGELRMV